MTTSFGTLRTPSSRIPRLYLYRYLYQIKFSTQISNIHAVSNIQIPMSQVRHLLAGLPTHPNFPRTDYNQFPVSTILFPVCNFLFPIICTIINIFVHLTDDDASWQFPDSRLCWPGVPGGGGRGGAGVVSSLSEEEV